MKDLRGLKIGRWRVLKKDDAHKKNYYWLCECECGTERSVDGYRLNRGDSLSCGCLQKELLRKRSLKHGCAIHGKRTKEYISWMAMIERCDSPSSPKYSEYGGRGIKIHESWYDYNIFLKDVGYAPAKNTTLDRLNSNGNYEPGNVKWSTPKEQNRNKRNNTYLEIDGIKKLLVEWAEIYNINPDLIRSRIKCGWTPVKALTMSVRERKTCSKEL